jgi:ribosomal protein S21
MISVNKREGETASALIFRFTKKVRRSGVIQETRRRRFTARPITKRVRKGSAIFKAGRKVEMARLKKLGLL